MTRTRGTHVQTELAAYSRDFYRELAALSGVDVGYYPNGSLSLARTPERLTELRYALTLARHHGLPARELAPERSTPSLRCSAVGDLAGGVLFEDDATVNPGWAAFATAKAAHDLGVRVVEGVRVTGFKLDRAGASSPCETDRGDVECEVAVIAAGLWSRDLGLLAGARLALHPAEHYWAQTEPVEGATRDLPIMRDLDGSIYVRHYRGGLLVGAFEPDGRPRTRRRSRRTSPSASSSRTWSTSSDRWPRRACRVPALAEARFAHYLCAPESFTPDGNFLLGETAEVAGLFVAAGMNSQGIILGPGVGRALAEWIDAGAPTMDAAEVDVRRFSPAQAGAGYLFERTRESLGRLYAMHWPFLQPETARGLRRVPLYDRLAAAGACFGEAAGWERANWYAPPGERPEYEYSYGRQNWFAAVAEEHRAAREARRALRPLLVRQAARGGTGRARHRAARLHRRPRPPARQHRLHVPCSTRAAAWSSTSRSHGWTRTRSSSSRRRRRRPGRSTGCAATRDPGAVVTDVTSGLGVLSVDGPALARAARGPHRRRPRRRRLPVRPRARDRRRLGDGRSRCASRSPASSAGSCTCRWSRWPSSTTSCVAAGADARPAPRRLPRAGQPACREGLHPLGRGHGPADTPYEAGLASTVALDKPGGFIGREALRRRRRAASPAARARPARRPGAAAVPRRDRAARRPHRRPRHVRRLRPHARRAPSGWPPSSATPAEVDEIVAGGGVEVEIAGRRAPARAERRALLRPEGRRLRGAELRSRLAARLDPPTRRRELERAAECDHRPRRVHRPQSGTGLRQGDHRRRHRPVAPALRRPRPSAAASAAARARLTAGIVLLD